MRLNLMPLYAAAATALWAAAPATANVIGNSPYLCFEASAAPGCETAESPFSGQSYSYFNLETLEDGAFNSPGVSLSSGSLTVVGPGSNTDSVDEDDGSVDGSGTFGRSLFGFGTFEFVFDAAALGGLPTDVGIVWTDGDTFQNGQVGADFTFSFFDANGGLLGSITSRLGDASNFGGTAEDRFFGWTGSVGVRSMRISGNSIELDHLQYGLAQAAPGAVPEPATWGMMIAGFGLVGGSLRRRRPVTAFA